MKTLRTHRRRKGFTMVEIVVVLVILAILIGATTPIMLGLIEDARLKAQMSFARVGILAAQQIVADRIYAAQAPGAPALNMSTFPTDAEVARFELMVAPDMEDSGGIFADVVLGTSTPGNENEVIGITFFPYTTTTGTTTAPTSGKKYIKILDGVVDVLEADGTGDYAKAMWTNAP
jgi:prepilin-type N-terminal cleavage/methylation domain-containing protein